MGLLKTKWVYRCLNCGHETPRWMGQCQSCGHWNTLEETSQIQTKTKSNGRHSAEALRLWPFAGKMQGEIIPQRHPSGFPLLDIALGGGLLDGSLVLLGGAPGVGKSTLVAHLAGAFSNQGKSVLMASGEEAVEQLMDRLRRLGIPPSEKLLLASGAASEDLVAKTQEHSPSLLIVDSIQTIHSRELPYPIGSPTLIRTITGQMLELAKQKKKVIFLLGHITKDGMLAGPKHMEHMVDVVLQMEKPRAEEYRLLRVLKNRFGGANSLVVFSMGAKGLTEVADPSLSFLSQEWRDRLTQEKARIGLASTIAMEGGRPFLIQVEALVGKRRMSPGKRASLGIDRGRLEMLLAVLEKTLGLNLESNDIFLSLLGGIRVQDPGVDLSLLMALASATTEFPIATDSIYLGEVSLSGDVLKPRELQVRVQQAKHLGCHKIFYSQKGFFHVREFIQALKQGGVSP